MLRLQLFSPSEQVAAHLRGELLAGRWHGTMPGVPTLAESLGIDRKTVDAALRQLEAEGWLVGQGVGRRRRIELPTTPRSRALRVATLPFEGKVDRRLDYMVDLQHALADAGHTPFYAGTSLLDLHMDVGRLARLVDQTDADAWVVLAGSRKVLEWFSAQPVPTFAMFGRPEGLPVAGTGPDKAPAYSAATRRLVELGHQRIVLLARSLRRLPEPGRSERAFLDELEARGIRTGPYNLPDWEDSKAGLQKLLRSLLGLTPPTAIIVQEGVLFAAVQQFLAQEGFKVPRDVSLICTDADPTFAWCEPSIAHIRWGSSEMVRRVVRWADSVSRGKPDRHQTFTKAEFIDGGTVGKAIRDR